MYFIDVLCEIVGGIVLEILIMKVIILGLFGIGFMVVGYCLKFVIDFIICKIVEKVDESKVIE